MGSSDVGRRRREGWRILMLCAAPLMYIWSLIEKSYCVTWWYGVHQAICVAMRLSKKQSSLKLLGHATMIFSTRQ